MIIIIEGIDRVGKTTLANIISKHFGIPIFKQERLGGNNSNGDNSSEEYTILNYGRALGLVDFWNSDSFKDDVIVDRFHWTEAVYSKIDRHNIKSSKYMSNVEYIMSKARNKYFIIQVMPIDINYCIRQHGSDLKEHQKEFNMWYETSDLIKYRCSHYSYDLAIEEIERRLHYV